MSRVPPSVETLIRKHSHCRVIHASQKQFVAGHRPVLNPATGQYVQFPIMSDPLTDAMAMDQMVRQYR